MPHILGGGGNCNKNEKEYYEKELITCIVMNVTKGDAG